MVKGNLVQTERLIRETVQRMSIYTRTYVQSWSCVDCGFVGLGRNSSDSLNAVYNHVEKATVAAILKLYHSHYISHLLNRMNRYVGDLIVGC